jgi:lipoate-protein ligase B
MILPCEFEVLRLGEMPYAAALAKQREWHLAVERGDAPEALFLLQHPPVFTLGRNAAESNLLLSRDALANLGIDVAATDRGGDVTYHGPGQLVAYPIVHLDRRGLGIRQYLRALERAIIETLAHFGISGGRLEGFTGVWVDGAKVAAIGIAVHRGVSYHGIAINVDPNMDHWRMIVPCGIPDKPVTSLAALLGQAPPIWDVEDAFAAALNRALRKASGERNIHNPAAGNAG